MEHKYRFLMMAGFLFMTHVGYPQFSVESQLRNRAEIRNGYQKLASKDDTAAFFISQRTRLGLIYKTDALKLKIVPQDVRVWGNEQHVSLAGNNGNDASLDLYEGYAEIRLGEENWLAVGRQELFYDNQILLAHANWNQRGVSSDAILLKLNPYHFNLHIGASWNTLSERNSNNYYPTDRFKTVNFLWAKYKVSDTLSLSFMHITAGQTENNQSNKIYLRHTSGFYAETKFGNLSMSGNAYYQYGKNQQSRTVSAFLGHLVASYNLEPFNIGLGNTYLSGNKQTGAASEKDNLFNPIYLSRHQFFGFMDYFRNFETHTNQGGIWDVFAFIEWKPLKKVTVQNYGHIFSLAQTNPATPESKYLGYENNLICNYKFNDWGRFEFGYLFSLPTKAMEQLQNVTDAKFSQFIYLQLTLTPTLFQQQKSQDNL